jgi:hypothetical protein
VLHREKTAFNRERETGSKKKRINQSVLWILNPGVSYLYSFDTDPDPIRIQGFDDQKLEKIYIWENIFWDP